MYNVRTFKDKSVIVVKCTMYIHTFKDKSVIAVQCTMYVRTFKDKSIIAVQCTMYIHMQIKVKSTYIHIKIKVSGHFHWLSCEEIFLSANFSLRW